MISHVFAALKRKRTCPFISRACSACLEWILQTLATKQCLSHKGSRHLEFFSMCQAAAPKELERLHGRLIWFGSFIYGRMLNRLVKDVSNMARVRGKLLTFNEGFLDVLHRLMAAVQDSKPVAIGRSMCHTCIIFIDGAYEPDSKQPATFGAVLVAPSRTPKCLVSRLQPLF